MTDSEIFDAAGTVLLRAAARPVPTAADGPPASVAADLASEEALRAEVVRLSADPVFLAAVRLASPSLADEAEKVRAGAPVKRKRLVRTVVSLTKYRLRTIFRATPFGHFAGVALARTDDGTGAGVVQEVGDAHRSVSRPDAAWLYGLLADEVVAAPGLRERAALTANPLRTVRDGRVVLVDHHDPSGKRQLAHSVRSSAVVAHVLERAAEPVAWPELVAGLAERFPQAPAATVERTVEQLVRSGFLLSDLMPPPDHTAPLDHVLDRLAGIDHPLPRALAGIRAGLAALDTAPPAGRAPALAEVTARMRALREADDLIQSDLRIDARLVLPAEVGREAERAAAALWRTTVTRPGMPHLRAYHLAFLERYGTERAVPLLELLDEARGLGLPETYRSGAGADGAPADPAAPSADGRRRDQLLGELLLAALRSPGGSGGGTAEIVLDEATLDALGAPSEPTDGTAPERGVPASLELGAELAADSWEALLAGDFHLVLGANPGSPRAGATFGRFAPVLGDDGAALGAIVARAERPEGAEGAERPEEVERPEGADGRSVDRSLGRSADRPAAEPAGDPVKAPADDPVDVSAGDPVRAPAEALAGVPAGDLAGVPSGHTAGDPVGEPAGDPVRRPAEASAGGPSEDGPWAPPGELVATVAYRPRVARSANVATVPPLLPYRIPLGVPASAARGDVTDLRPEDLAVHADLNRMWVVHTPTGRTVRPVSHSMLNPSSGHLPYVARFLLDLGYEGHDWCAPWNWGSWAAVPALPRVRLGRTVLSPARWLPDSALREDAAARGDGTGPGWREAVAAWRLRLGVPRYVLLARADNRVTVDLDDPRHLLVLHDEVKRPQGLVVTEWYGGPEGTGWFAGPDGPHACELVVPLFARRPRPAAAPAARPAAAPTPAGRRAVLPGGEWLYAKLYVPDGLQDQVLSRHVSRLVGSDAVRAAGTDGWFFLRYADPDPHLRLRFQGKPETLWPVLLPAVREWAEELRDAGLADRLVLDTYDPETERYGGPAALGHAERVFHADSAAVLAQLAGGGAGDGGGLPVVTRAALGVLDLLTGLGSPEEALDWLGDPRFLSRRSEVARATKEAVADLFSGAAESAPRAARAETLAALRGALAPYRRAPVALSLAHMHCNRLIGPRREEEVLAHVTAREGLALALSRKRHQR
ncbi:thiopeptide-type bacteriocin biosynthesis protein [Streptomyces sp. NPDC101115]|uniref:thiopeptide-type bacteriocin biosynthesis protein n=1 Tax=Streptomyces sp. NPDC101115 TaxID=3366106 RepID=UPI0037F1DDA6